MSRILKWLPSRSRDVVPHNSNFLALEHPPALLCAMRVVDVCRHSLCTDVNAGMIHETPVNQFQWTSDVLFQALVCTADARIADACGIASGGSWGGSWESIVSTILDTMIDVHKRFLHDSAVEVFRLIRQLVELKNSDFDSFWETASRCTTDPNPTSDIRWAESVACALLGVVPWYQASALRMVFATTQVRQFGVAPMKLSGFVLEMCGRFEEFVASFVNWCRRHFEHDSNLPNQVPLLALLESLCTEGMEPQPLDCPPHLAGLRQAVFLKQAVQLLHHGDTCAALRCVATSISHDVQQRCPTIVVGPPHHLMWCTRVACLREQGELASAKALIREAYESSLEAFRQGGSARTDPRALLALLAYAREYELVLKEVALKLKSIATVSDDTEVGQDRATSSVHSNLVQCLRILSDAKGLWEKCRTLFSRPLGDDEHLGEATVFESGELTPLDTDSDHQVVDNVMSARFTIAHWTEYCELMRCRLWIDEEMSNVMLLVGWREASVHIFDELLHWTRRLSHPRWTTANGRLPSQYSFLPYLPKCGVATSTSKTKILDLKIRRGADLFHQGHAEDSIAMWQSAVRDLDELASECDLPKSRFRLYYNLFHAQTEAADAEGIVDRRKKLLTDALRFAYACQKASRSDLHRDGLLCSWRSTWAVSYALFKLGQQRKAALLLDDLLVQIESALESPRSDPLLRTSVLVEALALAAKCLVTREPERARQLSTKCRAIISGFEELRHCPSGADAKMSPLEHDKTVCDLIHRFSLLEFDITIAEGDAYMSQRAFDLALGSFSRAFEISLQRHRVPREVLALQKLSAVYREMDQAAMSIGYMKQAQDLAKEFKSELLWYRVTIEFASLLGSLGRTQDASAMWSEVLSLAQRFGDAEVERATAKNLLSVLLGTAQYFDVIRTAETLEKTAMKDGVVRDQVFALEALATAQLAVGEVKKSLEAVDRMEKLEDVDSQAHDTVNKLRAQALLAQRESGAAIDTLLEWRDRSMMQGNTTEAAKASIALAHAIVEVSVLDAKKEFFAVLGLCREVHEQSELLPAELKDIAAAASNWLINHYYLREETVVLAPSSQGSQHGDSEENQNESEMPQNVNVESEGEEQAPEPECEMDLPLLRENSSYGADDFEADPRPLSPVVGNEEVFLEEEVPEASFDARSVVTFNPSTAIEVMEVFVRLLGPFHRHPIYRSPQTVVEKCLRENMNCTFVFYFLDFSGTDFDKFEVLVRPAKSFFFQKCSVTVSGALTEYHRATSDRRPTKPGDEGTPECLYVTLRALHDALWEPVAKIASTGQQLHQSELVVVVPPPVLMQVPFSSLVSSKRKATGQRASIVVSPSLEHFYHHSTINYDLQGRRDPLSKSSHASWLTDTTAEKYFYLPSDDVAPPTVNQNRLGTFSSTSAPRNQLRRSWGAADNEFDDVSVMNITYVKGGTRKEVLSALQSPTARAVIVLCPAPTTHDGLPTSSAGAFRMSDGDVNLSDLANIKRRVCFDDLELVVMTCDRSVRPSIYDMGPCARLCTDLNCKRVLRIDVSCQPGDSAAQISIQHVLIVKLFLQFVHVAISSGVRFPYAVALQATQAESIRKYVLPPHIWGSITLVGAP